MAAPDTTAGATAWAVGLVVVAGVVSVVLGAWLLALVCVVVTLHAAVLMRSADTGAGREGVLRRSAAFVTSGIGPPLRTFVVRLLPILVGCVVVVVALDWTLGLAFDQPDEHAQPEAGTVDLRDVDLPSADDERADAPAYRDARWVDRYFAEFERLTYGYVPYLGPRVNPVRSRYINSQDGIRRSYVPPGADADAAEVWFFGGSTMFGEGQRDLHTIPSEVARLAEADGVMLRVVNFGERGYVNFQEFLLLEQELAARPSPDLAVFYDGLNEVGVQLDSDDDPTDQPTAFQFASMEAAFDRAPPRPASASPREPTLLDEYGETSAVNKLFRRVRSLATIAPVGAQDLSDNVRASRDALALYARSTDLVRGLADRHSVPVEFFWQPGSYLAAEPPPGVNDLTHAFDEVAPEDLYIDGAHTGELGAQVAAQAIWDAIRPVVAP